MGAQSRPEHVIRQSWQDSQSLRQLPIHSLCEHKQWFSLLHSDPVLVLCQFYPPQLHNLLGNVAFVLLGSWSEEGIWNRLGHMLGCPRKSLQQILLFMNEILFFYSHLVSPTSIAARRRLSPAISSYLSLSVFRTVKGCNIPCSFID